MKNVIMLTGLSGVVMAASPKNPASRPNILYIAIDDLKPMLDCIKTWNFEPVSG